MDEEGPELEHDGADLCLCCLKPLRPGANSCVFCGAPQNFFAATLPYQKILAEGFIYRRAVGEPSSWFVVAGVWVVLAEPLIMSCLVAYLFVPLGWPRVISGGFEGLMYGVLWLGSTVPGFVGGVACVMSTRNYLERRERQPPKPG